MRRPSKHTAPRLRATPKTARPAPTQCLVCYRTTLPRHLDDDGICRGCARDIDRCDPFGAMASAVDVRSELDGDPTMRAAMEEAADRAWEALVSGGYDPEDPEGVECGEGQGGAAEGYDDGVPAPLHPWHLGWEMDVDFPGVDAR